MATRATRATLTVAITVALLALSACNDRPASSAEAQRDINAAAEKTKDAAVTAGHKAADLADKARDNTREFFNSPKVQQDMTNAKEAVKGALDGPKSAPREDPARK